VRIYNLHAGNECLVDSIYQCTFKCAVPASALAATGAIVSLCASDRPRVYRESPSHAVGGVAASRRRKTRVARASVPH